VRFLRQILLKKRLVNLNLIPCGSKCISVAGTATATAATNTDFRINFIVGVSDCLLNIRDKLAGVVGVFR